MAPTPLPSCHLCKNASFKLAVDSWIPGCQAFKNTQLQRSASETACSGGNGGAARHDALHDSRGAKRAAGGVDFAAVLSKSGSCAISCRHEWYHRPLLQHLPKQARRRQWAACHLPQCHAPAPCILGSVHRHSAVSHAHPDLTATCNFCF